MIQLRRFSSRHLRSPMLNRSLSVLSALFICLSSVILFTTVQTTAHAAGTTTSSQGANLFSDASANDASANNDLDNAPTSDAEDEPKFLPVHDAFRHIVTEKNNVIHVQWTIEPGYYLYKKRFSFSTPDEGVTLGEPIYARDGHIKHDDYFGDVEIFHDTIDIQIPILAAPAGFEFAVRFQGCAEAGLCYPPTTVTEWITPAQPITSQSPSSVQSTQSTQSTEPANASTDTISPATTPDRHDAHSIAAFIQESSVPLVFGLFFILGLGLTFTPCVLPMVPILSGIIAGQQQPMTARKGFILSSAYVLGMAITFSIAGIIVSLSGARIQIYMQNPIVLSVFAALFVVLAFAMFGFYELQLPSALRDRLNDVSQKQKGGNLIGVFIMGVLSALVVSPCVSAPLAGVLLYVTQGSDAVKGGLALFGLGLGMGAPLIAIGTTGANLLPRAGVWMDNVKSVFGVLLLAVGAWMIRSVVPSTLMMWIWAALLIIPSIYMGALSPVTTRWQSLWKGIALMMLTYGVALIIGAAMGQTNPLKPLPVSIASSQHAGATTSMAPHLAFTRVTSVKEVDAQLNAAAKAGKPAMVDFYADWCIACVEMEHSTFLDARVIQALSEYELIQIDITDTSPSTTNALLDRFKLIGPPSILFFTKTGEALTQSSIMGEMDADVFLNHLANQVTPNL
ncbi:MAG: protein-disulfide reductase DsbD [Gammaproteobacteria bacterium]